MFNSTETHTYINITNILIITINQQIYYYKLPGPKIIMIFNQQVLRTENNNSLMKQKHIATRMKYIFAEISISFIHHK